MGWFRLHYWVAIVLIGMGVSTLLWRSPSQGVTSIMPELGLHPDFVGVVLLMGGLLYPTRQTWRWHTFCASALLIYVVCAVYYWTQTGSGNAMILTSAVQSGFYVVITLYHENVEISRLLARLWGGD